PFQFQGPYSPPKSMEDQSRSRRMGEGTPMGGVAQWSQALISLCGLVFPGLQGLLAQTGQIEVRGNLQRLVKGNYGQVDAGFVPIEIGQSLQMVKGGLQ